MSVAKHTPGPWKICYDGQLDGPKGNRICTFDWDSYKSFNESNNAANARLIAAAPELLAALKAVQPLLDIAMNYDGDVFGVHHNDAVDAVHTIAEAIAKATGGAA